MQLVPCLVHGYNEVNNCLKVVEQTRRLSSSFTRILFCTGCPRLSCCPGVSKSKAQDRLHALKRVLYTKFRSRSEVQSSRDDLVIACTYVLLFLL